jgi:hypothetical protein
MLQSIRAIPIFERVLAFVGSALGILTIFVPNIRAWFSRHGTLGWAMTIFLLIFLPFALDLTSNKAARYLQVKKDCELIKSRLQDWLLNGELYNYLHLSADHNRFKRIVSDEIQDKCTDWLIDTREIVTKNLSSTFERVKSATYKYNELLQSETWAWDLGPGTAIDYEYVRVPVEWETTNPTRYSQAYDDLRDAKTELISALQNLSQLVHSLD